MKSLLYKRLLNTAVPVCLALALGWAASAFPFGRTFSWQHSKSSATDPVRRAHSRQSGPVTAHSGGGVVHVTTADFKEQVLKSNVPVLVDFYADWCGPCKLQAPVLDELARETNAVKIVKVNIDESAELAARYRINSLPSLLVFNNGREVNHYMGYAGKEQLKLMLTEL